MHLAEGIRKHGFRKWYERELLRSHAHLLLLFLCSIGLLASFGVYSAQAPLGERVRDVLAIVLLAGVGLWSLRRYLFLLMHAEQVANQAVCLECKTYGRILLVDVRPETQVVTVRCRKCEHVWTIND